MVIEKFFVYVYIVKLWGFFLVNIFLIYDLFLLVIEDFIIYLIYVYICDIYDEN